jgi:hypothetical protein
MVENVKTACAYADGGCTAKVALKDYKEHAKSCPFRPFECPRSRSLCTWKGPLHEVATHLKTRHKMKCVCTATINETYSNPESIANAVWEGPILEAHGQQFIVHFEHKKNKQYAAFVRHVGNPEVSKQFRFNVKISKNGRSMSWEGIPRSIRDEAKSVMDVNDCLVLENNMALFFSESLSTGDGNLSDLRLNIQGRIHPVPGSAAALGMLPRTPVGGKRLRVLGKNNDSNGSPKKKSKIQGGVRGGAGAVQIS